MVKAFIIGTLRTISKVFFFFQALPKNSIVKEIVLPNKTPTSFLPLQDHVQVAVGYNDGSLVLFNISQSDKPLMVWNESEAYYR